MIHTPGPWLTALEDDSKVLLAACKELAEAMTEMLADGYQDDDGYYVYDSNIREVNDALHAARAAIAQAEEANP